MAFTTVNDDILKAFRKTYRVNNVCSEFNHLNQLDNYNIKLAISRAYRDAQRRCKYIKSAHYRDNRDNKQTVKAYLFLNIYQFVQRVLNNQINNFNTEHENLCLNISGEYEGYNSKGQLGTGSITYGILQKIINMTFKYLYTDYRLNQLQNINWLKNIEDHFHCPIDNYILNTLLKVGTTISSYIKNLNQQFVYRGFFWSNINRDTYIQFLDDYSNSITNSHKQLECEFHLWSENPGLLSNETIKYYDFGTNDPGNLRGILFK